MVDSKISKLANDLIDVEFAEGKISIHKKIGESLGYFAAEGAGSSGAALNAVRELCKEELQNRTRIVIKSYIRALSKINIQLTPELIKEIKGEANEKIKPVLSELNAYVEKHSKAMGAKIRNLDDGFEQGVKKISSELDLFYEERVKQEQYNIWYKSRPIQAAIIAFIGAIIAALLIILFK